MAARWGAWLLACALGACGGGGGSGDDAGAGGAAAPDGGAGGGAGGGGGAPDDGEAGDLDGDGLSNGVERQIGTDPAEVDSDADGLDDRVEVGARPESPADRDDDGLIDALESHAADNDRDGTADPLDASEGGWQLAVARFYPFAIANDGVEATRVEVRITGGTGVLAVKLGLSQDPTSPLGGGRLERLFVEGMEVGNGSIDLFDDGTHGDRFASDGLWTRGGITSTSPTFSVNEKLALYLFDEVKVTDEAGETARAVWTGYDQGRSTFTSGFFKLGVVSKDALVTAEPLEGGDGQAHATTNLLILSKGSLVPKVPAFLRDVGAEMNLITEAVYQAYEGDPFDFIYVWSSMPTMSSNAAGKALAVSNDVTGINKDPFDEAGAFGSAGRLKSVIALDFNDNGPILHETMHTWGAYYSPPFNFDGGHWGYAGTDGQLGGFDPASFVDNGDGTYTTNAFGPFANGGDSKAYGPWELYLMGLIPPEDVPTVPVLHDAQISGSAPGKLTMRASRVEQVSVDDVVAMYGPRTPPAGEAPTEFAAAFVVVAQRPLTRAETTFFDAQAALFGAARGDRTLQSFAQATGGRATMSTTLP